MDARSITFPVALEKSTPLDFVSKYIVENITAGKIENIPPQTGPKKAAINIAEETTPPESAALRKSSFID